MTDPDNTPTLSETVVAEYIGTLTATGTVRSSERGLDADDYRFDQWDPHPVLVPPAAGFRADTPTGEQHRHLELIVRVVDVPAEPDEVADPITGAGRVGVEAKAPNAEMAFVGDAGKTDAHDVAPSVTAPASVL